MQERMNKITGLCRVAEQSVELNVYPVQGKRRRQGPHYLGRIVQIHDETFLFVTDKKAAPVADLGPAALYLYLELVEFAFFGVKGFVAGIVGYQVIALVLEDVLHALAQIVSVRISK